MTLVRFTEHMEDYDFIWLLNVPLLIVTLLLMSQNYGIFLLNIIN